MATDWKTLHQQFLTEHSRSGISAKVWCEKNKINYATARRHIKLNAQPEKYKMRSKKDSKTAQESPITKMNKQGNQLVKNLTGNTSTSKSTNKNLPSKKRAASFANQNARTFGHYSEFITTDEDAERYASASNTKLDEELKLVRMQLSNLMVAIKKVEADLDSGVTVEQKTQLYESCEKFQTAASVKIARIESLENSLIRNEKIRADIEKTVVMTEKAQLEADKLRSESNGSRSPLQDIYDEILAMDNDGMMNIN